ncbi:MAG: chemotaxis protein [Hyphomicrobiaceae bacterium]
MPRAVGEEVARQPYELVRVLNALQDESARGNAEAHARQRQLISRLAQDLLSADAEVWKDARNVRAAVVYALSGGEPRVLKSLFALRQLPGVDEKLLNAALAYSEGRNTDVLELLNQIDARALDPGLGARVALVHSGLVAAKDPKRAIRLLEDARLLAPGTVVEDAALRRQAFVVAGLGDFDAFEMLASQYMRRFPNSIYANIFREQFAGEVTGNRYGQDADRLHRLEAMLEGVDTANRRHCYLLIAQEAVRKGRVELARLAARHAVRLTAGDGVDHMRSRVYEAAVLIVTEDYDSGVAALMAIDKAGLDARDAELLDAAFAVAEEVRRPSGAYDASAPLPEEPASGAKGDPAAPKPKSVELAQKVVARVDAILAGVRQ